MNAAQIQQWRGLSPHAAERVASTILLHCLIHKPQHNFKNLGLRHEVAIRVPVRLLLTVSLQDHTCVSDLGSLKGAIRTGVKAMQRLPSRAWQLIFQPGLCSVA